MGSFLRKLAEHAIPLGVVVLLMAGSAVAGGMITGSQIQNGSITGRDVKDKSLTPKDFSGSVKGEKGDSGTPGGGALETELVQKNVPPSTTTPKEQQVDCPNGPVLSGGYVLYPPALPGEQGKLRAIRNYAVDQDSWLVRAVDDTTALSWELTVVAVCAT